MIYCNVYECENEKYIGIRNIDTVLTNITRITSISRNINIWTYS